MSPLARVTGKRAPHPQLDPWPGPALRQGYYFGELVAVEPVMGLSSTEVGVMPKELIYNPNVLAGRVEEAVEHIAVGWAPDRDVQIGLTFGSKVALAIDGLPSDFPSVFMDLDRAAINRLIHLLRKARDSAYGKDA